jgi:hypothetical protein
VFKHFLLLHTSIYILCRRLAYDSTWVNDAGQLLCQFVAQISELYYKEFYVYNVHSLLHLHLDVLTHGPLDLFSAFEFENHMQSIKKMIRTNRLHLSHVVRRVIENDGLVSLCTDKDKTLDRQKFSEKEGDNCFITNDCKIYVITSWDVEGNCTERVL